VVATSVQGHLETVRHDETGLLVPPGDAGAMADAAERLLLDDALADELAERGREEALASFTAERYRSQVLGLLRGLVEGHR